jgi:hypothetical protein
MTNISYPIFRMVSNVLAESAILIQELSGLDCRFVLIREVRTPARDLNVKTPSTSPVRTWNCATTIGNDFESRINGHGDMA